MASETIKFAKVNALPGTYEGSTVYLVKDATNSAYAAMYISNADGTSVRRLPNRGDIESWINTALSGATTLFVVADIAARNALAPTIVTQAIVIDATADTSVIAGAATYVFNPVGSTWTKISENESMDLIIQWANISGKPTSTAAAIDDAVTKKHAHANLAVLDKFSEDLAGDLKYNNIYVDPVLRAAEW